jgi:hypothetical protein
MELRNIVELRVVVKVASAQAASTPKLGFQPVTWVALELAHRNCQTDVKNRRTKCGSLFHTIKAKTSIQSASAGSEGI